MDLIDGDSRIVGDYRNVAAIELRVRGRRRLEISDVMSYSVRPSLTTDSLPS
jgi:hypothetical protein